jgi:hypothetical protein
VKREDRERRANEIVARLTQFSEQDRKVIQQRATKPVEVSVEEVFAFGKRDEERSRLVEALRKLACEEVEDCI